MRAIVIARQGTPVSGNVRIDSAFPDPIPGRGEALVRTEAAALNHLDLWVGRGLPGIDLTYPRIGGSDGAGVVQAVGPDVDASWTGKRVLLNAAVPLPENLAPDRHATLPEITMIGEHVNGCLAEHFVAPVSNLLAIGDLDPVQAAAFGLTYLTAWRMMVNRAGLRPGQSVLITGIGGGVALAALKIALHLGCTTIVTSRSPGKLDRARALGAHHLVHDTGADWSREVRTFTGKRGVDLVVDSVGKAIHLSCIKSLARGGTFATCGTTTGPDAITDLSRVFWNQLRIVGSTMGSMQEFAEVIALLRCGALKPVIDGVFKPDAAAKAYARLEAAEQFGKIVIDWR